MRKLIWVATVLMAMGGAEAEDAVRYYQQNGATIREARTTVQVPVNDVRFEEQTQTYYRSQVVNQVAQVAVPSQRSVTQYRWVPKWHGWWNILREPHLAYHLESDRRQVTAWQAASVPVTQTTLVPETRTTRVAVPYVRYEPREQVARTVMLPSTPTTQLAAAPPPSTDPRLASANFGTHPRYAPYNTARPSAFVAAVPPTWIAPQPTYTASVPAAPTSTYVPPYASLPWNGSYAIASRPYGDAYGGVARLDGDLPRYSTNNPYGVWQARRQTSGDAVQR